MIRYRKRLQENWQTHASYINFSALPDFKHEDFDVRAVLKEIINSVCKFIDSHKTEGTEIEVDGFDPVCHFDDWKGWSSEIGALFPREAWEDYRVIDDMKRDIEPVMDKIANRYGLKCDFVRGYGSYGRGLELVADSGLVIRVYAPNHTKLSYQVEEGGEWYDIWIDVFRYPVRSSGYNDFSGTVDFGV